MQRIGDYALGEIIGRGGIGVVYRARDAAGREVAIKVLGTRDAARLARFERERRLQAALDEAHGFVPLIDAGDSPQGPYLVMPLVPGGTLRDRLARGGALSAAATIALGAALARALGEAHALGIVHRDLKPENVLFTADERPLVADLGLAKHFSSAAPGASQSVSLSKTGELRGSAAYMPPEQIEDASKVGPRADVYSLGAILYECLAGRPAFEGDNLVELLAKVTDGIFEPLRAARPDTPPRLARAVERAMARDAEDRFADARDLARALEPARDERRASPWRALIAGGALVLLAAAVAALAAARRAPGPPHDAVAPVATQTRTPAPAAPASLPPGLRLGPRVPHPETKEIQLYLWKLPDGAGDVALVQVPAGDFAMGADDDELGDDHYDSQPKHLRPLEHEYWIARDVTTWGQYDAFCKATGHAPPPRPTWWGELGASAADHPVVNVTWDDARAYCAWAGLVLPTEVEWEKAARGTDGRIHPWRGEPLIETVCDFADADFTRAVLDAPRSPELKNWKADGWKIERIVSDGYPHTAPVGSFPAGASPCGALDMVGEVRQWCDGWYEGRAYKRFLSGDETPTPPGKTRVVRGGAFTLPAAECRVEFRGEASPTRRLDEVGFRVCLRRS